MKVLSYDCFAGISGDMNLAAMIDLGVDENVLRSELEKLRLEGWSLRAKRDSKCGIFGTRVDIVLNAAQKSGNVADHSHALENETRGHGHEHGHLESEIHAHDHTHICEDSKDYPQALPHGHGHSHEHSESVAHGGDEKTRSYGVDAHKHSVSEGALNGLHTAHAHDANHGGHSHRAYKDIKILIGESGISEFAKKKSLEIFEALAVAEAKVHGKSVDEVHFHEVGAVDSIIDIVGAAICVELLGVDKIVSSAVELGGGTVRCAHGVLPVPAPATAILAKNFPSKTLGAPHECTTPTGAAIISVLADEFCVGVSGKILSIGTGIGHRDCPTLPNILRAIIYESDGELVARESLSELSANIDDMTPEHLSELCARLFEAGALDVWQESIAMKKGRLASKISALVRRADAEPIAGEFFRNSTTLGVRECLMTRRFLKRDEREIPTSLGIARFKSSEYGGLHRVKPEFEDCSGISRQSGIPIWEADRILKNDYDKQDA